MTQDLPAGLAEPLHILEPAGEGTLVPWLLALALVAAFVLWWAWWRRRRAASGAPAAADRGAPAPSGGADGISARVREIRGRYLDRPDRRPGCHELASVLRDFLEPRVGRAAPSLPSGTRPSLAVLTAREIAALLGDSATGRFLERVALHQFGRVAPDREEFRELCDVALDVVAQPPGRLL